MKIGCDIEKVKRFEEKKEPLFEKLFTSAERVYAEQFKGKSAEHLAGFYCAKEALVKALGVRSFSFKDVEIAHKETGEPYFVFNGEISVVMENVKVALSISHCEDYAMAVVCL